MIVLENEPSMVKPLIKVIGIGGAGGNAVNSMIEAGFDGIEFIAANTDAQALNNSKADQKIQLGTKSTKGLGTGANPQLGRRAAEEDIERILDKVGDAEIVFFNDLFTIPDFEQNIRSSLTLIGSLHKFIILILFFIAKFISFNNMDDMDNALQITDTEPTTDAKIPETLFNFDDI